jgi:dTDP-4-dehydrorhamnose 3,5-epimerase-like enzyme
LLDLAAGAQTEFQIRAEADRFLFAINGRAQARLLDLRPGSPTHGASHILTLDAADPRGLLVPFGLACALYAETNARLILLSTHSEAHAKDRIATPDELEKYTAVQ